jgi:hypothetical protein
MKKTLLTTLLLFFGFTIFAQVGTDLEFNQIINARTSNNTAVTIGTVPSGKIWKVVGFTFTGDAAGDVCQIREQNFSYFLRSISTGGIIYEAQLPIFFKENETLTLHTSAATWVTVSIIEFTVLP